MINGMAAYASVDETSATPTQAALDASVDHVRLRFGKDGSDGASDINQGERSRFALPER